MIMKRFSQQLLFTAFFLYAFGIQAQISISSLTAPYTQNFNSLRSSSGSSSTLPSGWRLTETGSAANSRYTVDAGANTTGDTYSYGAANNTERALGTLQSASLIPAIGAQFRNTTGRTVTSLVISYTGEQWRCGATGRGADRLDFQYSLNASSLTNGNWVDNNLLDFSSLNVTSAGSRNGNLAENRALISTTITGLNIANNAIFWIRWTDFNVANNDDGLAIDDFSISLSAADLSAPNLISLTPVNNATGISITPTLNITFNESVQKGTGNILIRDFSTGSIVQNIDVATTAVNLSGASATFSASLNYSQRVYVEIPAGAFRDLAGNNYAGFSGNSTWSFTTESAPLPALDTLKIVNWNIEWFGGSLGPADDNLQQQNVQTVLTNINADIYALQEVVSASRLQSIVNQMPGYALIIGDNFCSNGIQVSSCVSAQKLAYIYKTNKVNLLRSYPVLRNGSANASYNWSSGRFPYLIEADVTLNGATRRMVLVNVHAKANTSDFIVSYNRRKAGAAELRDSLNVQFGTSNVIVLGDLNDDLDKTITTQIAPDTTTSWIDFKNDVSNFNLPSLPLSLARISSTASYPDIIDHAIISNELNALYVSGSARILRSQVESWIPSYSTTTSDHFPLETRFIWSGVVSGRKNAFLMTSTQDAIRWSVADNQIRLMFDNADNEFGNARIINVNGSVLFKQPLSLIKGANQQQINYNLPAPGLYIIQLTRGGKTDVIKIIK